MYKHSPLSGYDTELLASMSIYILACAELIYSELINLLSNSDFGGIDLDDVN